MFGLCFCDTLVVESKEPAAAQREVCIFFHPSCSDLFFHLLPHFSSSSDSFKPKSDAGSLHRSSQGAAAVIAGGDSAQPSKEMVSFKNHVTETLKFLP